MIPTIPEEIFEIIFLHASKIQETDFEPWKASNILTTISSARMMCIASDDEHGTRKVSRSLLSASLCCHTTRRIALPLIYESMMVATKFKLSEVAQHLRAELRNIPNLKFVQYVAFLLWYYLLKHKTGSHCRKIQLGPGRHELADADITTLRNTIVTYLLTYLPNLRVVDLKDHGFENCDISLFSAIEKHQSLLRVTLPFRSLESTSTRPPTPSLNLDLSKLHIHVVNLTNRDSQELVRECLSTGCNVERVEVGGVLAGEVPFSPEWTSWVYPGLKSMTLRGSLHCFSKGTEFDSFVSRHPYLMEIIVSSGEAARLPQCDFPLTRSWCNSLGRLSYALKYLELSRTTDPVGYGSFKCRFAMIHASTLREADSHLLSLFISRVNESFPDLKDLTLRLNRYQGHGDFMESTEVWDLQKCP
jgi:hypothetical protein